MCFSFKKNNKQTKKPVNCFLQDDTSASLQSLQTSIEIKLCQKPMERTIVEIISASPKVGVTASKLVPRKKDGVLGVSKLFQINLAFLDVRLVNDTSINIFFKGLLLVNLTRCTSYWDDLSVVIQCL